LAIIIWFEGSDALGRHVILKRPKLDYMSNDNSVIFG